jgi:hypothetical protein
MTDLINRTQQAGTATTLYDFCSEDTQFELPPSNRISYEAFRSLAEPAQANGSTLATTTSIHALTRSASLIISRFYWTRKVTIEDEPKINQETRKITFTYHHT